MKLVAVVILVFALVGWAASQPNINSAPGASVNAPAPQTAGNAEGAKAVKPQVKTNYIKITDDAIVVVSQDRDNNAPEHIAAKLPGIDVN